METLKAYFSVIDPRLFNHVSGKPGQFIRTFQSQNFLSEDAFAHSLYDGEYDENSYREWKSRSLKILQALAIISETRGGSLVKKKYDFCQKKFLLGQKFISQRQRSEGVRLIKQAYEIATEYDFSHLASELASILYHNYVYYQHNNKKAELYADKAWIHLQNYTAEKNAMHFFWRIVLGQRNKSISVVFLEKACQEVSRIQGNSVQYKVYEAMINILHNLYTGAYKEMITNCTNVLNFFKTKKGTYSSQYLFFLRNRGTAYIATREYIKARISFEEAGKYLANSAYNKYTLQFYKTLNALHAEQYLSAYQLFQKNKRCKIEDIRQHFAIIEAYLCFLSHAGLLKVDKIFRMSKYLNDTFKAQADKKGDNINIVIAQLLIHLVRDRGRYIDYIETVQSYSYRHLKGEDTKRAKLFLKILCTLAHPRVGFHPEALKRKAGKYIELLKQHPIRMGGNFMIEIIPYDHLLEMILTKVIPKAA